MELNLDNIGWNYGYWKQSYISIDDTFIIRSWKALNVMDKAFKLAECNHVSVKIAIITILKVYHYI